MVCIFCDIHINNIVLSSFVFSLEYLHHKKLKQNKSTCNWHFVKCVDASVDIVTVHEKSKFD